MKTRTFKLDKLVRDKIVSSTKQQGGTVKYKTLRGKKLTFTLIDKFIEEAQELKSTELTVEELADLQELIDQIAKNLKITKKSLEQAQAKKRFKNGGFKKGHFIESLSLPMDNKWVKYYSDDPKRFPEIQE